jgi:hypothetical protein
MNSRQRASLTEMVRTDSDLKRRHGQAKASLTPVQNFWEPSGGVQSRPSPGKSCRTGQVRVCVGDARARFCVCVCVFVFVFVCVPYGGRLLWRWSLTGRCLGASQTEHWQTAYACHGVCTIAMCGCWHENCSPHDKGSDVRHGPFIAVGRMRSLAPGQIKPWFRTALQAHGVRDGVCWGSLFVCI